MSRLDKCFPWGIDPGSKEKVKKLFLRVYEKWYGEPTKEFIEEIERL